MRTFGIRAGVVLSLCGLLAIAALADHPQGAKNRGEDGADKATFEAVCGSCHSPYMTTDLRSFSEWVETVDHMISIGAKGSTGQFDRVLSYLAHTFTRINVNAAAADEIAQVLDIDDASAQAVVRYRAEHGNFRTVDDLKRVPGMSPAKIENRKDRITF